MNESLIMSGTSSYICLTLLLIILIFFAQDLKNLLHSRTIGNLVKNLHHFLKLVIINQPVLQELIIFCLNQLEYFILFADLVQSSPMRV